MMMMIRESKFSITSFNDETKIMENKWKKESGEITEKEIHQEVIEIANAINTHSPASYIADELNKMFAEDVEVQNWAASLFVGVCIAVGLKKFAIVIPNEALAQLPQKQAGEETDEKPFELAYFADKQEALRWIKGI